MHSNTPVTPAALAELLGVTRDTVSLWARRGRIRVLKTPGGHYRIPRSEVERLLVSRRQPERAA